MYRRPLAISRAVEIEVVIAPIAPKSMLRTFLACRSGDGVIVLCCSMVALWGVAILEVTALAAPAAKRAVRTPQHQYAAVFPPSTTLVRRFRAGLAVDRAGRSLPGLYARCRAGGGFFLLGEVAHGASVGIGPVSVHNKRRRAL